jgi:hypothetical protein
VIVEVYVAADILAAPGASSVETDPNIACPTQLNDAVVSSFAGRLGAVELSMAADFGYIGPGPSDLYPWQNTAGVPHP